MSGALRLRPPRVDDEAAVCAAHRELALDDFEFAFGLDDDVPWRDLVQQYEDRRRYRDLADGFVPSAFLLAVVDGEVVGRTSIRFELNDYLARFGGHIGYGIRPSHRRHGYATEVLRQSLVIARAAGVDRALVTCDDDNVGSSRAIETCGGVLESIVDGPEGAPLRRYWIA